MTCNRHLTHGVGDLAVFDPETRGSPAIVAGHQMQVIRSWRRRRRYTAMRVARGRKFEFARGGAVQKPGGQNALINERELLDANALGIEWLRAQAPATQWIIDDADIAGEELLAQAIFQKAGLARDRRAVDRANQVADQ